MTWWHVCLAVTPTAFHAMHVFNAAGANQVAKNAGFVRARKPKIQQNPSTMMAPVDRAGMPVLMDAGCRCACEQAVDLRHFLV